MVNDTGIHDVGFGSVGREGDDGTIAWKAASETEMKQLKATNKVRELEQENERLRQAAASLKLSHEIQAEKLEKARLFKQALRIVIESQRASISYLQRRMKLNYHVAAGIMDQLQAYGIVSPASEDGVKREVMIRKGGES